MPRKRSVEIPIKAKNLTRGPLKAVGVDIDKLGGQIRRFNAVGEKITKIGDNVAAAGRKMTIAGLAVAAAIAIPTTAAAKFETGLARVATLIDGDLSRTMQAYGQDLKNLSVETNTSLKELNDGLYDAISAGVDTGRVMDFMSVASKSAAGGFTDVKTAVNGLTSIMNSYKYSVDDALKVSDEMALAVKVGKTTMGELGASIGRVASVAANFGVTSGDLLAGVATITKAGVSTDEAVTAVRALLVSIASPAKDAKLALKSLQEKVPQAERLRFTIESLQNEGLLGFFNKLIKLTGGNADALNELIGSNIRAASGFFNLAQQADAFNQTSREMQELNAAGSLTLRNFGTRAETAAFKLGQMKKEMSVLLVELGTQLIPTIVALGNWIKPIISRVIDWIKNNQKLVQRIGKFVIAIGAALLILGPTLFVIGKLIAVIGFIVANAAVFAVIGKVLLAVAIIAPVLWGAFQVIKWIVKKLIALNRIVNKFLEDIGLRAPRAAAISTEPVAATPEALKSLGFEEAKTVPAAKKVESKVTNIHKAEEKKRTDATKNAIGDRVKALLDAGKKVKAKTASVLELSTSQFEKLRGRFFLGESEYLGLLAGMGGRGFATKQIAAAQRPAAAGKKEINIDKVELPDVSDPETFVKKLFDFTASNNFGFATAESSREVAGSGGLW